MIDFLLQVGWETWSIFKEASLFLLFGFAVAGVLAVVVPSRVFMRFLGTGRVKSVLWASIIGVPVPLCSCGVLPTALGLVRQGASKGATVAFLIATPETGVDSIAMSWALMDPLITAVRPLVAIITAIVAGLATNLGAPAREGPEPEAAEAGLPEPAEPQGHRPEDGPAPLRAWLARGRRVATYAFRDLFDETAHWLALGVGLSALVAVLLPSAVIERYLGGGLGTMLLMFLLGIPIYTCASASTPVAAALVLKGLSPGAALVFLLSGPATNLGALVVLLKFLGRRVMLIYLTTVAILSLGAGYALDWIYRSRQLNATASFGRAAQYIPDWVNVAAALVMIGLLLVSLWRTPVPAEWIRLRDWAAVLTGVGVTAKRLRVAAAVALGALYLGGGFYTVGVGEVGLQARFGRIVDSAVSPGLHYRLPWPIDGHRIVESARVRRIEVGFRTARPAAVESPLVMPAGGHPGFWYRREKVPEESFLLTGDENIIDIAFTVQYAVRDPVVFAYQVAEPEELVRSVAISVLRSIVATTTVDAIYTSARDEVERRAIAGVQALLDAYGAGVQLVSVNLLSVHAPEEVHAAFRDVASAHEDKLLIINRATTFAEEGVNLAQGDAAAMVESARAFKAQRIMEAEGDALAFALREKAYRRAPELTRFRLYVEALEEIMPGTQKILRPGRADVKDFDLWLLQPLGRRNP
ncbi:MAG: FtsH protease activity modulator HflK [Candidatus Rokuibacteriota bacterium]|nr:MAG: FtsH protease activity modulator HflK [Candidatus Rokubacteria bacterium]